MKKQPDFLSFFQSIFQAVFRVKNMLVSGGENYGLEYRSIGSV